MDTKQVRIEVLKLCYRHDQAPENTVERARILEGYILSEGGSEVECNEALITRKPLGRPKKTPTP